MILVQFFTTPSSLSSFFPPPLFLHSCLIQPLFLSSFFKLWYYLSAISPFWSASLPLIPFSSHSLYTSYVFALALSSSPADDLDWCLLSPFLFLPSVSSHPCLPSHNFFRTIFFSLTFKTFSLTFFLVPSSLAPLPSPGSLCTPLTSISWIIFRLFLLLCHLSFSPLLPPKLQEETDIVLDFGVFAWLFGCLEMDLSDDIAFLSFEVIFLFMGLWS